MSDKNNKSAKKMNDRLREASISQTFDKILKAVEGGKIYGKDVNITNPQELVVSAYFLGRNQVGSEIKQEIRKMKIPRSVPKQH